MVIVIIAPRFPRRPSHHVRVAKDRQVIRAYFADILALAPIEPDSAIVFKDTPVKDVGNEGDTQHFE